MTSLDSKLGRGVRYYRSKGQTPHKPLLEGCLTSIICPKGSENYLKNKVRFL